MSTAAKRQRKKDNARAAREQTEAADRRSKQVRKIRNFAVIGVLIVGAIVLINSCSGSDSGSKSSDTTTPAPASTPTTTAAATTPTTAAARQPVTLTGFVADPTKTYTATIDTNFGSISIELDSDNAPKAAGRFIELARAGFYDGLTWHRAVPDFVIQGGDPEGTGAGGSGNPPVVGETPTDGYPIGSLAAAKAGNEPAGSFDAQFFIVTGQAGTQLPPEYARFGKVTAGQDVAEEIEGLAPGGDGPPTKPATIEKITIRES